MKGAMFEPVLLEKVDHQLEIYRNEVFGPVAIIEAYSDFESGIACINRSRFALQAGVYTQNLQKMMYAWDHLHVGGVIINDIPSFRVDNMPYGGVKRFRFGPGRDSVSYPRHAGRTDAGDQNLNNHLGLAASDHAWKCS